MKKTEKMPMIESKDREGRVCETCGGVVVGVPTLEQALVYVASTDDPLKPPVFHYPILWWCQCGMKKPIYNPDDLHNIAFDLDYAIEIEQAIKDARNGVQRHEVHEEIEWDE